MERTQTALVRYRDAIQRKLQAVEALLEAEREELEAADQLVLEFDGAASPPAQAGRAAPRDRRLLQEAEAVKRRRQRGRPSVKAQVLSLLERGQVLSTRQLLARIRPTHPGAVHSATCSLVKAGLLERVGPTQYRTTYRIGAAS